MVCLELPTSRWLQWWQCFADNFSLLGHLGHSMTLQRGFHNSSLPSGKLAHEVKSLSNALKICDFYFLHLAACVAPILGCINYLEPFSLQWEGFWILPSLFYCQESCCPGGGAEIWYFLKHNGYTNDKLKRGCYFTRWFIRHCFFGSRGLLLAALTMTHRDGLQSMHRGFWYCTCWGQETTWTFF